MALQMDYETDTGYSGNYWVIDRVDINREGRDLFTVLLYKDSTAYSDSRGAMYSKIYKFPLLNDMGEVIVTTPFTEIALKTSTPYEVAQTWLLSRSEWSTATPVS
jgi:hypothetical protein